MIALAPRTVQNIPERFKRSPMLRLPAGWMARPKGERRLRATDEEHASGDEVARGREFEQEQFTGKRALNVALEEGRQKLISSTFSQEAWNRNQS
jgi:hypothetical protein